ncbi:MAG: protein kinase [Anaerolineae bacterium]|nr:protein kinase [Anaerolineae bacterium]
MVKIAPAALVEKEYEAYRTYIRDKLSGVAEIRSEPTLIPDGDWGGLRYHLVGSGIFEVESLLGFLRRASIKDVWHVLEKRLFARLEPLWRFSTPRPEFSLQASYDRLLPVNLLLAPATPPPGASVHLLKPNTAGSLPIGRGSYVRVEGFLVEEVDYPNQAITLNLPPPGNDLPASYRLRIQPVEPMPPCHEGDVASHLEGLVAATRHDLLQEQVARVLGQDIATAYTLGIPDEPEITLPNPLTALPTILSEPQNVRIAGIHGDLNVENVLVDTDARDVSLIDFCMARRDHVLHDLLRLETGVVTRFLPKVLVEAGLPAETVCDLYEQVHHAVRRPGHLSAPQTLHSVLRKPFVILVSIREAARECLYDLDDWKEYYQGLTLYLMGALKFKNLDEAPQAPLPKQVAFWGAAAAQKLLQGQSRYDDATWQPLSAILDDLTGQMLGQYKIVRFIDQGSMGAVYQALQIRLQRDVAIKVMSPALAADATFRQRFEREAQSIARLRHPNILTVHDYGETEDGRPYLVIDYVEGGTLHDRLATSRQTGEDRLTQEEAIALVAQVAEALDYAHCQGVVHRDVKPNNILLSHDGCPLLADFGLAKPVPGDRRLTGAGVLLGTPDYMAPEQAQEAEIDGRADIYALGVVLFEMLAGRHPFAGETPISIIIKHISEPLPRPSALNPAVSPRLDEIVARATAKSPEKRYRRAGDLARALRAAQGQATDVPARPRRPVRTSPRRRGLLWTGGAVIAAVLLMVLAWWLAGPHSPLTLAPDLAPTWQQLYDGEIFTRGPFTALVVDPQDPNVMYAGIQASGIFKSLDGGASWQHIYNGPGDGNILDLAIDPDTPQTLYAISSEGDFEKSTDGGLTRQPASSGIPHAVLFRAIVLHPQDSRHIYLKARTDLGDDRIYESRDGGASWEIRGELNRIDNMVVDPQDGERIYVAGFEKDSYDTSIYRSDGPGIEWEEIWPSSEQAGYGLALAIAKGDPPTLYVGERGQLYRSQDGGANWTPIGEGFCSGLRADPYNEQILYCWSSDFDESMRRTRVSFDGGLSWEGDWPTAPYFIAFDPDGQTIYAGSPAGLLRSSNRGQIWGMVHAGPTVGRLQILVDPHNEATLYALDGTGSSYHSLYRSQDRGLTWRELATPKDSEGLAIDPVSGALYRFEWYGDEIYRSTDGGRSWATLTLTEEEGIMIKGIAVHPRNGALYAFCGGTFYISKDDGLSWNQDTAELFGDRLYFDHQQGETRYLLGNYSIYQSTDNGQHWNACEDISGDIVDAAIDPSDGQRIFVATKGAGVWASENGCMRWEMRSSELGNLFVSGIAVHPANPDIIYAATSDGVYVSRDGARQWELVSGGEQNGTVAYDIAVDPRKPHNVYVSTPLGIFELDTER